MRVKIKVGSLHFSCYGRERKLCSGCHLRFMCATELDEIVIEPEVIKKNNLCNLNSIAKYMFSKSNHKLEEVTRNGRKKLVMIKK